jgi:hypothetical protein
MAANNQTENKKLWGIKKIAGAGPAYNVNKLY